MDAKRYIRSALDLHQGTKLNIKLGTSIECTTQESESIFRALQAASSVLLKSENVSCSIGKGLEAAAQCVLEETEIALNEFHECISVC